MRSCLDTDIALKHVYQLMACLLLVSLFLCLSNGRVKQKKNTFVRQNLGLLGIVVSKSNHSTSRHMEKALFPQHLIPVPMVNMKPLSQYTMVSNVI